MIRTCVLACSLFGGLLAGDRQIAITFDDLPFAHSGKTNCDPEQASQRTVQLMKPFRERKIPVTGFVIGNGCSQMSDEKRADILRLWLDAGARLENHTFTHPDFNNSYTADYTTEIERTSAWMKKWLHLNQIDFFRSPYLHVGETQEKKSALERYLKASGLRQGVVTIDNSDWMFANVYARFRDRGDEDMANRTATEYVKYLDGVLSFFEKRTVQVVGQDIPHVLLLHANWLNADHIQDVLNLLERRGYSFISLKDAMSHPAYEMKDGYLGTNGISWLHRWGLGKGIPIEWEPDVPSWVKEVHQNK